MPLSTGAMEIPAEIIDRFRARALERIDLLESDWLVLTARDAADPDIVQEMRREIHTLKGDSRVVGFTDVNLLSHKLEDLLAVAHRLEYRVAEEFDLVVTMGFRFLAMLVRKKAGSGLGGIDLPGFLVEIDGALRDASLVQLPEENNKRITQKIPRLQRQVDRLAVETRQAIAASATAVFLEHLNASGQSRQRLHGAWRALSGQLASMGTIGLRSVLTPHTQTVTELANELGKTVDIRFDFSDASLSVEAATSLDTALLHLLRNAVSHGLETPEARRRAGKRGEGRIAVRIRLQVEGLEIEVEDDGGGIDFAAIRQRGVERGLITERRAASASEEELVDLLFQPGFSTSPQINDLSGRGVGLDAVRATLAREGGSIGVLSRLGEGTTFVLHLPQTCLTQAVHCFPAAGRAVRLALPARPGWTLDIDRGGDVRGAVDPLAQLAVATSSSSGAAHLLRFERYGEPPLRLRAGGPATRAMAERVCPTGDDQPAEVVLIDGVEALLLRPAHLARPVLLQ
ncbi:MAG TPA: ATP-binding protein [Kofleriaceae bacterium]